MRGSIKLGRKTKSSAVFPASFVFVLSLSAHNYTTMRDPPLESEKQSESKSWKLAGEVESAVVNVGRVTQAEERPQHCADTPKKTRKRKRISKQSSQGRNRGGKRAGEVKRAKQGQCVAEKDREIVRKRRNRSTDENGVRKR